MASDRFIQVEGWFRVFAKWFFFGGLMLCNWTLEGAGLHRDGMWTVIGAVQVLFNAEDFARIQCERYGPRREDAEREKGRWNELHVDHGTQLQVSSSLGPTDRPSWSPS